ncbi:MAG: amino acid adenylation domain-containing protein [Acidimicrobiia bacterium]|nr:amino acid adenylation domain-containing protein [Acidimicrobiia bacterium]
MTVAGLENVEDIYPLSPMQQGMVFHTISEPGSGVFINQIDITLRGTLDVGAFKAAWADLVSRHAMLRTVFLWDGLDEPLQVVREQASLEWTEEDWSSLPPDAREQNMEELLAADRRRGFDLTTAPLTRMAIIRAGDESWRWVWSTHHAILDGWSAQVLLDELWTHYDAHLRDTDPSAAPPFPYRNFIRHLSTRDEAAEEAFWRERLQGFSEPHRLEVPGLAPAADSHGYRSHSITLDVASTQSLEAMARENQVTLNTAVVGAWSLLLARWTREREVVFGVTNAGRPAELPGCERGVGLFINTSPLRIDVDPQRPLGDWLRRIQSRQVEARAHEQCSLAEVQRWSDTAPGDALFESIFVFENYPPSPARALDVGVEVVNMDYQEQSNYPLAVLAIPGESLTVTFVYDTARLATPAVESLGAQLTTVLRRFAEAPEQRLSGFDLLETDDQARLDALSAGPAMTAEDRCVHHIIEDIARDRPEAVAVSFDGRALSYGDLDRAADRVAGHLQAAGVTPDQPVGLYLPRSAEMIIGLLAILKAGGAYVPLDPSYPPSHIQRLLDNDAIEIVLTDTSHRGAIAGTTTTVLVDEAGELSEVPEPPTLTAANLAYVIHTSGSTGRPKAVAVTHANLVHSTLARTIHYKQPVDRFLLLSSFSFDSSVVGIFWTLCSGGTLVLPAQGHEQDISRLLTLASEQKVTHLLCLPALYQLLAEHADEGQLSSLRVAIVAGEACPSAVLEAHLERVPDAEFHNEYGPTEATVWCTVHRATQADVGDAVPIGRPIAGGRVYLLDDYGRQVAPGFVGEICVAGPGVATGYLGRPDLTAERFTTVDIDGTVERIYRTGDLGCYRSDGALLFLGRTDVQLKVRGYRIEPGAVEAALGSHPDVREAAVSSRATGDRAAAQLVAYVVLAGDGLDTATLRRHLRDSLPAFMVPDLIVPIEKIPRLPNGKVNAGALPDPAGTIDGDPGSFVPPHSETERKLATIWADILGVDREAVAADSDFFALGGHSLLAIRLMSAVHTAFGTSLPLAALFEAPRLAELATLLEPGRREYRASVFVPIREAGDETLFLVHPGGGNVLTYEPLARHLPDDLTLIGIQARGVEGTEEPDRTIEAMARRYANELIAAPPPGPINLAGYSTGGLIAFEMARILEREGHPVGLVALLDTVYPVRRGLRARLTRELEVLRAGKWQGVRTVADWWWSSIRALAGRIRHGPRWRYYLAQGRPLPAGLAAKRITHIGLKAERFGLSGPYAGTLTYIRALGDDTRFHDSIPKWETVAGKLVVLDTPGHHTGDDNIVTEPHVGAMAAILAEQLRSTEGIVP